MSALTLEQHEVRATGIGGSEIAAVVGLSPWMKPIDVWRKKVGLVDDAPTKHTHRGRFLEAGVRLWYASETGRRVELATTMRHPTLTRIVATPDGIVYERDEREPSRVLEVKCPDWRLAQDWGEAGTDQVPDYYVPQAIWEMAVTGTQLCDFAALIDGGLRIFTVRWDRALFEALAEQAHAFWRAYVETKTPPPPDGSPSYDDYLATRFPRSMGVLLHSTDEIDTVMAELQAAEGELTAAEHRAEAAKQRIKDYIGDADGVEGRYGRCLWRSSKDRETVAWKALCEELRPDAELVAKFTSKHPGPRSFRASWKKG